MRFARDLAFSLAVGVIPGNIGEVIEVGLMALTLLCAVVVAIRAFTRGQTDERQ